MQISASLKFRVELFILKEQSAGVEAKLKTETEDKGGGIMVSKVIQHST
jgi:hypothetical protein